MGSPIARLPIARQNFIFGRAYRRSLLRIVGAPYHGVPAVAVPYPQSVAFIGLWQKQIVGAIVTAYVGQ